MLLSCRRFQHLPVILWLWWLRLDIFGTCEVNDGEEPEVQNFIAKLLTGTNKYKEAMQQRHQLLRLHPRQAYWYADSDSYSDCDANRYTSSKTETAPNSPHRPNSAAVKDW